MTALRKYRVGGTAGQFAGVRAIFSALILYMPEEAATVVSLSNYSGAAGPPPPPGSRADVLRRRTHVRLPAPLTLRLNRIIEVASEQTGQRCSRTAVVVSLMRLARRESKALWRDRFTTILTLPAGEAVPSFDSASPDSVLRLVHPKPGPRPQGIQP